MRSVRPNDFAALHALHPTIELIACNGSTAEQLYRRRVLPGLAGRAATIEIARLPSTSPAHASLSFERKRAIWARVLAGMRK